MGQLADRHLFFTDVEKDEGLNAGQISYAPLFELGFDHLKALAMQLLDQPDRIKKLRLHLSLGKVPRPSAELLNGV
ncbi:hypothetical protein [Pelagibius sp.]|uniref:hypothetical protein n=1 Tax=Pelagibius sp. TaxID=1931238 RepID=UPI00261B8318|nr:hypothetical protein [Pelagibius sp.]